MTRNLKTALRRLMPSRRWLRFSLRSLLAFTALVSVFFAWFGYQYRVGQRDAAAIRRLGGSAMAWRHWDLRWGRTIGANLNGADVGDQELAQIAKLPNLRMLLLEGTHVTDEGLVQLQKLKGLRILFISDTEVSDRGLEHLRKLPRLTMLQAHRTKITDAGVQQLQEVLPDLQVYYTAR